MNRISQPKGGPKVRMRDGQRMSGQGVTHGFCIYIDTICDGPQPVERNADGFPFVYATAEEAERCIAEDVIERLKQYMKGERDFADAITIEEYVVAVEVTSDGAVKETDCS